MTVVRDLRRLQFPQLHFGRGISLRVGDIRQVKPPPLPHTPYPVNPSSCQHYYVNTPPCQHNTLSMHPLTYLVNTPCQ